MAASIEKDPSAGDMIAAEPGLSRFALAVQKWRATSGDPTLNDILPIAEAAFLERGAARASGLLHFAREALAWHETTGDPTISHLLPIARDAVAIAEGGATASAGRRNIFEAQERAKKVLSCYAADEKVVDLYDDDADFADALRDLAGPAFEYPDFSWLTVGDATRRAERLGRALLAGPTPEQSANATPSAPPAREPSSPEIGM